MAILDLRPASGSVTERVLKLGLVYDHEEQNSDGKTVQVWMNYSMALRADFVHPDDTEVTFTDMDTHISKSVTSEELKTYSSVVTWRMKNGIPGTTIVSEGDSLDLS